MELPSFSLGLHDDLILLQKHNIQQILVKGPGTDTLAILLGLPALTVVLRLFSLDFHSLTLIFIDNFKISDYIRIEHGFCL
jgi:hypothetical protein